MEKRRTFRQLVVHVCFTIFWQFILCILILYLMPLLGIAFHVSSAGGKVFLNVFSWIYLGAALLILIHVHVGRLLHQVKREMDLTNERSAWMPGDEKVDEAGMESAYRSDVIPGDFDLKELRLEEFYQTAVHVDRMKLRIREMLEKEKRQKEELVLQISAAAHDVKTPLTVIKGNAELLLAQADPTEGNPEEHSFTASGIWRQCAQDIYEASGQMEGYVNHLISYAKTYYEDKQGLREVHLCGFFGELVKQAELIIQDRAVFTAGYGKRNSDGAPKDKMDSDIVIRLHPDYVSRAVSDMVSNALAYSTGEEKRISLSMELKDEMLFIRLWNSGSSVSEEVREHFGTLFYRADAARSAQGEHYGIGLAFINRVARMHGGEAWIKNVDEGVETGMNLPL